MRVMYLRSTVRRSGTGKQPDGIYVPKKVKMHRLNCPRGWDGFMPGDILRDSDGFEWRYADYELGEAKNALALRVRKNAMTPALVFHWSFNCEKCGEQATVRMGASWRPVRRRCFSCNPANAWRNADDGRPARKLKSLSMEVGYGVREEG